ncbi:MAG TPA: Holliday junction resolvase RuvX [Deltaproteobacteria bacterium]|nr:MAG: Holliday junction DNA helicase RuvA [Deltaproteobacteria bacterium GWA2_45_12]HBF13262.1 Holliday junction resolvase RuvX [Deltaproteobacteria bacterium]
MRILGLDVGTKTVGVALSDPLRMTAQPVETIRYQTVSQAWKRLAEIIKSQTVRQIVVGLPLNMNGSEGPQSEKVRKFMDDFLKWAKNINVTITFWDERLSTVGAERVLLEADLSRAKRAKVIDKMAAVFILQGYLDSLS